MGDYIAGVILVGWMGVLFIPRVVFALALSTVLGAVCGYLVYLGTIQGPMPNDVSLETMFGIISPLAALAIFLAWPIGAVVRWLMRRKNSTGT